MDPLCEILLAVRLHAEEAATHVNQFPCEEQRKPRQGDKGGGAGAKHCVTGGGVGGVATIAKVAVTKAIHNKEEGGEAECSHPQAVDEHVTADLPGEDANFEWHWRSLKDIRSCDLQAQAHIRQTGGDHNYPHYLDRR